MKVFAIRHVATRRLMPAKLFASGTRAGWSYWEPNLAHPPSPPRLFMSYRAANTAAWSWARGVWRPVTATEGTFEEGFFDVPAGAEVQPRQDRSRDDLEVVELVILEDCQLTEAQLCAAGLRPLARMENHEPQP